MGLISQIQALGYQVEKVRFVDLQGRKRGGFDVEVFRHMTRDRFTSLRRSDLAAAIYSALGGTAETIFDDSVASVQEQETCVSSKCQCTSKQR